MTQIVSNSNRCSLHIPAIQEAHVATDVHMLTHILCVQQAYELQQASAIPQDL